MAHHIAVVQLSESPEAWSVTLDGSRVLTFSGPLASERARERSAEIDRLIQEGPDERKTHRGSDPPS